ncbi:MAG TPA: hypothetical protein VHK01_02550 [Lacipirellulaceae bacterium]|nr:hypothetical protein [Lacipirellulaceae bacterium]
MATERTNVERDVDTADVRDRDVNPDPITGEPGAHPVGAGVGAAVGGAVTGLAAGAAAGPIGAGVGAVVGGIAGGLAGKAIAEQVDPTVEEAYWRDEYANRDYYDEDVAYDEMKPAYRYGWESRAKHSDKSWDQAEPHLEHDWSSQRGTSQLEWERARHATRDAWERIDRRGMEEAGQGAASYDLEEGESCDMPPRTPK